ncbi:MAG TPA: NAD-dependent epimerase/dehydratase family protein [Micromonosporaceae bacterium]|nr:NAD-dependent epimerase/dehydratase family protein [Micromonosporaceae bacterium]
MRGPHSLVLGGAGFIGRHLTRRLLAAGHAVTVVDDFSRGQDDPDLAEVRRHVDLRHADLTDPAAYRDLPRDAGQVYLLAAVVGVRNVERDPARTMRVNTLVTQHVLDWISGGQRLFFASTSETYAGAVTAGVAGVPTAEDVPLLIDDVAAPRFGYAISKLWGEAAVIHTARVKGFGYVIGRFHNVYGPRMGADHVIPELALRAMRGEDPFRVYGVDQFRAFCFVDDAVDAIVRLVATDAAQGGIVHIGTDAETNIGDLAKLILRTVGVDPALRPGPAPAGSVSRRCPDISKLRTLTGFEPTVSLEDGVRRTVGWYQARWSRRARQS